VVGGPVRRNPLFRGCDAVLALLAQVPAPLAVRVRVIKATRLKDSHNSDKPPSIDAIRPGRSASATLPPRSTPRVKHGACLSTLVLSHHHLEYLDSGLGGNAERLLKVLENGLFLLTYVAVSEYHVCRFGEGSDA